ncbi:hypothetical protein ACFHWD_04170 [Clostridium sp. MT-14]|uniref:hypothetical protein n=1 Tax=Clostridium sp. MT-14 TaxID=3348360 RepID=UPI0035F23A19
MNDKNKLIIKSYYNNLIKYNNSMKYLINSRSKLIYYKKDKNKYYNEFMFPIHPINKYKLNKYLLNFHRMNIDIIDTQKFLHKIYKSSILKIYKKYYLELKSNEYEINKSIFSNKYVEKFGANVTKKNSNKYLGRNCHCNIEILQEKRKYLKKNTKLLLKNTNKQQKWLGKPIWKQILKSEGKTKFLDLKPTWYIIESDGLIDILIIPNIDYPYESEAVGDINKHPISSITDINYNDVDYGINKIAVSIKIMQQMLNFLFVIWNGKATDFSDISATEAIGQTMAAFYNWLNISKVQEEMDSKNVREDYLRVYRWFRWEAEKVWIEEYNTEDTGLKAVGMLVANIIRYMKNHHYNIVPITNRSYLFELSDILRAFTIKFVDYYKSPEKVKGRRNYYLKMKIKKYKK